MKAKVDSRKKIESARKKFEAGDVGRAFEEVQNVLKLDETNPDALGLRDQILFAQQQKGAEAAAILILRSEAEANFDRRVELIRQAAAQAPDDPRTQMLLALNENKRDVINSMRARARYLEERRDFDEAIEQLATLKTIQPADSGIDQEIERVRVSKSRPPEPLPPVVRVAPTPVTVEPPVPVVVQQPDRSAAVQPAKPAVVLPPSTPAVANRASSEPAAASAAPAIKSVAKTGLNRNLLLAGAAVVLVVVMVGIGVMLSARGPAAGNVIVQVQPADAHIDIDGTPHQAGSIALKPGSYKIKVARTGYSPVEQTIPVPGPAVNVVLTPLKPQIRVDTNLSGAEFSVDGQPANPLDGQAIINDLDGHHTIKVIDPKRGESTIEFDTAVAKLPRVTRLDTAKDMVAFAVSTFDRDARLDSKSPVLTVRKEDGSEVGRTGADGLALPPAAAGEMARLTVGEGDQRWPIYNVNENRPVLSLFLGVNVPATGAFLVKVNENDAVLRVDGKLLPRVKLKGGEWHPVRDIDPGKHQIKVERAGFRADPPVRTINVAKGKEDRIEFNLIPVASLEVRGAVQGAHIIVNDREVGLVGKDGNADVAAIDGGPCKIELRRAKYTHKPIQRTCPAGEKIVISGEEAKMTPTFGYIEIRPKPSDAKITAHSAKGEEFAITPPMTDLPEGVYTIRGVAPGYRGEIPSVRIVIGRVNSVGDWALKPDK